MGISNGGADQWTGYLQGYPATITITTEVVDVTLSELTLGRPSLVRKFIPGMTTYEADVQGDLGERFSEHGMDWIRVELRMSTDGTLATRYVAIRGVGVPDGDGSGLPCRTE